MTDSAAKVPVTLQVLVALGAALGSLTAVGGTLVTIGAWRGQANEKFDALDKRLSQAEANQRTYIPVVVGMQRDISYLAERARREDERAIVAVR